MIILTNVTELFAIKAEQNKVWEFSVPMKPPNSSTRVHEFQISYTSVMQWASVYMLWPPPGDVVSKKQKLIPINPQRWNNALSWFSVRILNKEMNIVLAIQWQTVKMFNAWELHKKKKNLSCEISLLWRSWEAEPKPSLPSIMFILPEYVVEVTLKQWEVYQWRNHRKPW